MNWDATVLSGWGRVHRAHVDVCEPGDAAQAIEAVGAADHRGIIAYGGGRSYGDAALLTGGRTILTSKLNQIHEFDSNDGTIVCGPGVTFDELMRRLLPSGYLVPVSPGTAFASIGGAIANDIHGKNHDTQGGFGRHVRWMDLLLPTGEIVRVSSRSHKELLAATIGGVGLTGIILKVCFRMQRVPSNAVVVRKMRIRDLDHYFEALDVARVESTYSVGWMDGLARGRSLGRGILETAEAATESVSAGVTRSIQMSWGLPRVVFNRHTMSAFNRLYYNRIPRQGIEQHVHLRKFLYPLDSLLDWNRLYGKRGFYQFQCVVPDADGRSCVRQLLEQVSRSRHAPFLSVLKTLGSRGEGYLSFPMSGYTLAMDFPRTAGVEALLSRLEQMTADCGGRVYLAKDATCTPALLAQMYPDLDRFRAVVDKVDPEGRMMSDLARRLKIRQSDDRSVAGTRHPGKAPVSAVGSPVGDPFPNNHPHRD